MAETCWEILNADISHWGGWCRLFQTSDDKWFVVDADVAAPPAWITTVIRRKTAVFWCNEYGGVTDLIADFEFPPMTTAEQAVENMGYTLTDPQYYVPPQQQVFDFGGSTADAGSTADFGSTA